MLKRITIKNLILIEEASIDFQEGLTIITGETGAGKTAFTQAIALSLGARGDSTLIRKGEEKASVEAAFDMENLVICHDYLLDNGIEIANEDFLIVKREIVKDGKNRCFINGQMVSLSVLQKLGSFLIDVVTQHEHKELLTSDYHRQIIDLFGALQVSHTTFLKLWNELKTLEEKRIKLRELTLQKEREEEFIRSQLEELNALEFKEHEEELLFEEYKKLASINELTEKIFLVQEGISASPQSVSTMLTRYKNICESLTSLDATLKEPADLLKESFVALKEASSFLDAYIDRLENNPKRFTYLEERLSLIAKFKRKYGNSLEEVEKFRKSLEEKVYHFDHLEESSQGLETELASVQEKTLQTAHILSEKRHTVARTFEGLITSVLQELNMKEAEFKVVIKEQPLSSSGQDHVEFYLKTNKGEPLLKVKECSSGGELSRLLFSIKIALSEKNNTPTLIFDEIDANVGGTTASIMGEKLHALGQCRQVFCITHFPQVAKHADHNISIYKKEVEDRTVAYIHVLNSKEKEKELLRMLGGLSEIST